MGDDPLANATRLFDALATHNVQTVLIGGLAAVAHGVPYVTTDIDLCYATDPENCRRLVAALTPFQPTLRVAGLADDEAATLGWRWDLRSLRGGPNLTLATTVGPLDLLSTVVGIGTYAEVHEAAVPLMVFGKQVLTLDLPGLIASKRAAGRVKDQLALPQIEATLRLRDLSPPGTDK
jgi:hypothetical protein